MTCHLDPVSIQIAWKLLVMLFSDFYAKMTKSSDI